MSQGRIVLPATYAMLLEDIKARIRLAQVKAALSVNRELIQLYWDIGRLIAAKQQSEGWGAGVVDRLSRDIQREFPGIEGFSSSNVSRMRAFYLAWRQPHEAISAQAVPKSPHKTSAQAVPKLDRQGPPGVVTQIPWGHNVVLLFQVPEYAGKMNFYLSAVDDLMRKPGDGPSIGLILCKDRSRIIAEYALRYMNRPVGVARYMTRLTERLPKELEGKLPTVKEIVAELAEHGGQRKAKKVARRGGKSKRTKQKGRP